MKKKFNLYNRSFGWKTGSEIPTEFPDVKSDFIVHFECERFFYGYLHG